VSKDKHSTAPFYFPPIVICRPNSKRIILSAIEIIIIMIEFWLGNNKLLPHHRTLQYYYMWETLVGILLAGCQNILRNFLRCICVVYRGGKVET
jgi:hypothetical protein